MRRFTMRLIAMLLQRGHCGPLGQRNSSRNVRHSTSVSKSVIRPIRSIEGRTSVMTAPKPKKAREMTTDEAMERIFGKDALKSLREMADTPARKPAKRKKKPSN